jgi:hypothetical protein
MRGGLIIFELKRRLVECNQPSWGNKEQLRDGCSRHNEPAARSCRGQAWPSRCRAKLGLWTIARADAVWYSLSNTLFCIVQKMMGLIQHGNLFNTLFCIVQKLAESIHMEIYSYIIIHATQNS